LTIQLLTPKSTYTIDYPIAIEFAETQNDILWTAKEIKVEKDLQDLRTNFTPAEYHGVVSTLKLFTLYELRVGDDYWNHFVAKVFQRPDIQRMANCFAFVEINIHAPFYNKINEVLGLDTDEFYSAYLNDDVLRNRMSWIAKQTIDRGDHYHRLKSLAVFSMIEGAVLYSSFAFLKHFQCEGKNKLMNVNAGINFSVKDENIHSEAGAWLFRTYLHELFRHREGDNFDYTMLTKEIVDTARIIYEHECIIIDKIFEYGDIKGITSHDLKTFVKSRINLCLQQLAIEPIYEVIENRVAEWFYKNINTAKIHDFFVKQGNEYNRNWNEKGFVW